MRIAYLTAGAAGMYCGSCLHDNTLAAALLAVGEDVLLVPIYTPIRTDEQDVSQSRVFYGGINAYLQQKIPLFRHTPRWLDRWLDRPALLRLLAGRASSVDPAKLGPMTVSMLRGEAGNQRKELEKLVDWLIDEVQPDVVQLPNSMMLGLARMITERCGPPIVCALSGEDLFLERLPPPYYEQARQLLRERAAEVAAFTALNDYYADFMTEYLAVPRERITVIPHGLNLDGHGLTPAEPGETPAEERSLRIGFLARICEEKGFHLLVEACELLASRIDAPHFELHAAGYLGAGDRAYFRALEQRIGRGPLAGRFVYHGSPDRKEKIRFLQSLHLMSTPTVYRESKGLPVLEALANGTPVVVPRHGTFPELLEKTGGGLLHEPHDAEDLAATLEKLMVDRAHRDALGAAGQAAVAEHFHAEEMARQTLELYRRLLQNA